MTLSFSTRPSRALSTTAAALACSLAAVCGVTATAQAAQPRHHMGFLHRHRTAGTVGAALVAHHMAKKGAASRAASGRKPNFAERHPILSGAAAGAATHHMLKKH